MEMVARAEGILPALETAHAFAVLPRLLAGVEGAGRSWPEETVVLVGLSGRGDKDLGPFANWREARQRDSGR
jgi:tryptophan synthase beta chain